MTGTRRIAICGVFDFDNYGDLLFPIVARHRLAPAGMEVVPVAPTALPPGPADAIAPGLSLAGLLGGEQPFAGIVVGGGYVIQALPMDFIARYGEAGVARWAGAGIWIGATIAAALADLPLVWNAPGVPQRLTSRQKTLIAPALRAADYLSVRDRGAIELLDAPADLPVAKVPDPIADLSRIWPAAGLAEPFRALIARKGGAVDDRFVAVHMRDRSVAGIPMADLAARLDRFAREHGLTPLLIPLGRSHDDPATLRALSSAMEGRHILLDDPLGLREITAALAFSSLYLGASLHGYVAAASYGVPGIMVGRPAYRKFAGFLEHLDRTADLATDWDRGFALADRHVGEGAIGRAWPMSDHVFTALDRHWEAIRQGLADPARRRGERQAFLHSLVRAQLAEAGPESVLRPYLSRISSHGWPGFGSGSTPAGSPATKQRMPTDR